MPAEPEVTQIRLFDSAEFGARAAIFSPNTARESDQSIECVMATENSVPVQDWDRMEAVDEVLMMEGARFAKHIPLLNSHNRASVAAVLGHVEGARVVGHQMIGRPVFDKNDRFATLAFNKVRGGHITDFSIGYVVNKVAYVEPGERADINGRNWQANERPLRLGMEWTVKELSLVPIGADPDAKARQMEVYRWIVEAGEKKDPGYWFNLHP